MWCCFEPAPRRRVLELGEVADLGAAADDAARAEVAERADRRLVLDRRRLDDARPDARTLRRSSRRSSWLPAPITLPSPTVVAPRRMTFGSRVTSAPRSTVQSR